MATKTPYRIVPKRDFGNGPGFWLPNAGDVGTKRYGWVKSGFVVTDGMCNIMPGATWFRTVAEAHRALVIWVGCHGDAQEFWEKWFAECSKEFPSAA
jgi:hypothetical protein